MGLALHEKRKEFEAEHEKLGSKPETAEEAMSKLPRVVKGMISYVYHALVHIISYQSNTLSLYPQHLIAYRNRRGDTGTCDKSICKRGSGEVERLPGCRAYQ